jgi:hypothetical protein
VERFHESADGKPPYPMAPYSDLRVAKFIAHVLLGSLLTSIPLVLVQSGTQRAVQQREEQERMQRITIDLEKAARQGNAGEAARRLLGIRTYPQSARQRATKAAKGPGGVREAGSAEPGAAADRRRE